ncbi:MAG TPA: hypothetical protein VFV93_00630 [Thermomicrobiales bacterium]|nr:hypothetical protein [Thermomicrobiales bacterium]
MLLRSAAVVEERVSFCLAGGERCQGSPFLFVDKGRTHLDGRAKMLLALADPVERAAGDAAAAQAVIAELREAVDGRDPDEVLGALHATFATLSRRLLAENRANAGRRKVFLGLTCVVRCGDDLFIAQVPPGQALIRQDGCLFAFPKLRSWLPVYQPSRTYELPNPLGLREITEPQVYYTRVVEGDLLAVASSSIAARLEPLEDELRDAAGVDDVQDTLADLAGRHGLVSGEAGVVFV